MSVVYKRALAEQDLLNIWLYTWHEWGEQQADAYLDGLDRSLRVLAEQPYLGRERQEFSPPVRIYYYAHHLVVYQIEKDGITVIRVLHKNMDIDTQLH